MGELVPWACKATATRRVDTFSGSMIRLLGSTAVEVFPKTGSMLRTMRPYATVELTAYSDGVTLAVSPPDVLVSAGDTLNLTAHVSDKEVKLTAKVLTINNATAANDLYWALKAAETGANDAGPHWNTKALVEALRTFYGAMEGQ